MSAPGGPPNTVAVGSRPAAGKVGAGGSPPAGGAPAPLVAPGPPGPAGPGGQRSWAVAVAVGAMAIAVIAVAVLAAVAFLGGGSGSDDRAEKPSREVSREQSDDTSSDREASSGGDAGSPGIFPPSTTFRLPSTTTTTSPSPTAVTGTVSRTCGANGRGDCFVSVRAAPTSKSAEIRRIDEGMPIDVLCQVPGQAARSSVLDRSVPVWLRLSDGHYVANVFVDAIGFDPLALNRPCPA